MFKKVALVLVALLLVLVAVGFFLPSDIRVTRSTVIAAEREAIYPHVATLKSWPEWTEWNTTVDPTAQFTFEGAESGKGAIWRWKGAADKLAEGSLEIVDGDPASGIEYALKMSGGVAVDGSVQFAAEGQGTLVTWSDHVALGGGPVGGWLGVLAGSAIEKALGTTFEKNLAGLKQRVESAK